MPELRRRIDDSENALGCYWPVLIVLATTALMWPCVAIFTLIETLILPQDDTYSGLTSPAVDTFLRSQYQYPVFMLVALIVYLGVLGAPLWSKVRSRLESSIEWPAGGYAILALLATLLFWYVNIVLINRWFNAIY